MKYCRLVTVVNGSESNSRFKGLYINYKALKKTLKKQGVAAFIAALELEVKRVNRAFLEEAHGLLSVKNRTAPALPTCILGPRLFPKQNNEEQLPKKAVRLSWRRNTRATILERVAWCLQFADVNATALRKLCKKADKHLKTTQGQQFLQACWDSSDPRLHAVLRSPLITELRALESRLLRSLPTYKDLAHTKDALRLSVCSHGSQENCACPANGGEQFSRQNSLMEEDFETRSGHGSDDNQAGASAAKGSDEPQDFTFVVEGIPEDSLECPVCLSPVFEPMALPCGHFLCQPCLMRVASLEYHLGSFRLCWACAPSGVACPQCRHAINEFPAAMPNLGHLSRKRFPTAWDQREHEDRMWVLNLRAIYESGNKQGLPIVQHFGFEADELCCC